VSQVFGSADSLWWVALKTLLLYVTAMVGLRLGERRTLAEMSAFDFVAAVAVGAIVGRIPSARDSGYLAGAVTLVTLLLAHRLVGRLRSRPLLARLVDHSPRLLVVDGRVCEAELRRTGLTRIDLVGLLRQREVYDLSEVRYLIFEQGGGLSVVRRGTAEGDLLADVTAAVSADCGRPPAEGGADAD
jgi:uncharacterized membrane protein YcaP (DUF421 family)